MKWVRSEFYPARVSVLLFAIGTLAEWFATDSADAQGTFHNMDFGLSQVPNTTPWGTLVPANQAFPFWTAYYDGTNQLSNVLYNGETLGSVSVDLLTPDG